jgi:hypothetical protein
MSGDPGSKRSTSAGSWGREAQLATMAKGGFGVVNPYQTIGGIVTKE